MAIMENVRQAWISDNRIDVTWNADWSAIVYLEVDRRTNGGSWVNGFAEINGYGIQSYRDTSVQANSYYEYRVYVVGYGGFESSYSTNQTTYTTPAAPGKPIGSRVDNTTIRLDFDNTGRSQSATEIQRSTNGTSWASASTVQGTKVISATDIPGVDTWYYRVRNVRDSLASAWSPVSDPIATITPPAPPTLLAPPAVVRKTEEYITFLWQHNPIDGSPQEAAQIRYAISGGAWIESTIYGNVRGYTIDNDLPVNCFVSWQVRTKGVHADYGSWSSTGYFSVFQIPQVNIILPDTPIVTEMPIMVEWDYSDESGYQIVATAVLVDEFGREVYAESISGAGTRLEIEPSEFLPTNHKTYILRIDVRSSSSLTASADTQLEMDYTEPFPPAGTVAVNELRGSAALAAYASTNTDPDIPVTVSVGIFRRYADGRTVSLVDQVQSGTSYTDLYPPLDQDFEYVFVSYAATGATSQYAIPAHISSRGCAFFNYGDTFQSLAKLALDTTYTDTLTHDCQVYDTASDESPDPLAFYGPGSVYGGDVTGVAMRRKMFDCPSLASIEDLRAMSQWRGDVIMRLPQEMPMMVTAVLGNSFTDLNRVGSISQISVAWKRVRASGVAL